jgi:hypothetical protein
LEKRHKVVWKSFGAQKHTLRVWAIACMAGTSPLWDVGKA